MNQKSFKLLTVPVLVFILLFTASFSIKKASAPAVKNYTLSVAAGLGPGPVHIDIYVNGATPGYTVYFTVSYNDGQRVENYSTYVSESDFHTVVQAPLPVGFADVTDFYELP